jgi:DSBA-like thioredoxin domain
LAGPDARYFVTSLILSRTGEELHQFMMKRYGRALNLTESALAKAACAAGPESSATPLSKSILNPVQRMWNTGLSHILVQLAGQQEQKHHEHSAVAGHSQLQTAMVEAIFKAHFEQGLNISDAAVLIALAEEVGVTGAAEALSSHTVAEQVASFQAAAKAEGAAGVPYFTVKRQHYPGRFRFCGAQPTSTFVKAFQKLLLDRTQLVTAISNKMATAAAEAEAAAVSALLGAAVASSPTDEQLAVVESFKHSRSTGPYGGSGSGSVQQRHNSASSTTTQQIGQAFRPLKKRQRLSEDVTASAAAAVTVQQQQQQHSSSGSSSSSSSGDKQDALPASAHVKQNNNSNSTNDSNSGYYQYGHFHTGHHGEQLHHEAQQQQQQQRPSSYSRQMFSQQQGYNAGNIDTTAKDSQVKTDNSPASSSSSGMPEDTTSVSAGATITVVDQPAVAPSSCTMTSTTAVATTSTQDANTQQQQQQQQQQHQQQRQQQGWFLAGMRHLS